MIKLILLDDHKIILDGVSTLIASYPGIRIIGIFQNPNDALKFIDKNQTDLVITDLDMPELKSEALSQITEREETVIKIII